MYYNNKMYVFLFKMVTLFTLRYPEKIFTRPEEKKIDEINIL